MFEKFADQLEEQQKQMLKSLVNQMVVQIDLSIEAKLPEKNAKLMRAMVDALVIEGFSKEEAIQLCVGANSKSK